MKRLKRIAEPGIEQRCRQLHCSDVIVNCSGDLPNSGTDIGGVIHDGGESDDHITNCSKAITNTNAAKLFTRSPHNSANSNNTGTSSHRKRRLQSGSPTRLAVDIAHEVGNQSRKDTPSKQHVHPEVIGNDAHQLTHWWMTAKSNVTQPESASFVQQSTSTQQQNTVNNLNDDDAEIIQVIHANPPVEQQKQQHRFTTTVTYPSTHIEQPFANFLSASSSILDTAPTLSSQHFTAFASTADILRVAREHTVTYNNSPSGAFSYVASGPNAVARKAVDAANNILTLAQQRNFRPPALIGPSSSALTASLSCASIAIPRSPSPKRLRRAGLRYLSEVGLQRTEDGHLNYEKDDIINRRFRVLRSLGQGTFGRVICVEDLNAISSSQLTESGHRASATSPSHAVEFLRSASSDTSAGQPNQQAVARVFAMKVVRNVEKYRRAADAEVAILKYLAQRDKHSRPLFVRMIDHFSYHGHMCILFEKLGISVFDFLKRNLYHPYPMHQVRHMSYQLIHAVSFLHKLGITHTDLKPENMLFVVTDYEKVPVFAPGFVDSNAHAGGVYRQMRHAEIRLIDFGSAIFAHEAHGTTVTTRHYRAPEVLMELGWSHPCDVWSVACIIFELYTGLTLFQTHDNREHLAMMERILGKLPVHLAKRAAATNLFNRYGKLQWDKRTQAAKFVNKNCKTLKEYFHGSGTEVDDLVDLVTTLFEYDDKKRVTLDAAIEHRYFNKLHSTQLLHRSKCCCTITGNYAACTASHSLQQPVANVIPSSAMVPAGSSEFCKLGSSSSAYQHEPYSSTLRPTTAPGTAATAGLGRLHNQQQLNAIDSVNVFAHPASIAMATTTRPFTSQQADTRLFCNTDASSTHEAQLESGAAALALNANAWNSLTAALSSSAAHHRQQAASVAAAAAAAAAVSADPAAMLPSLLAAVVGSSRSGNGISMTTITPPCSPNTAGLQAAVAAASGSGGNSYGCISHNNNAQLSYNAIANGFYPSAMFNDVVAAAAQFSAVLNAANCQQQQQLQQQALSLGYCDRTEQQQQRSLLFNPAALLFNSSSEQDATVNHNDSQQQQQQQLQSMAALMAAAAGASFTPNNGEHWQNNGSGGNAPDQSAFAATPATLYNGFQWGSRVTAKPEEAASPATNSSAARQGCTTRVPNHKTTEFKQQQTVMQGYPLSFAEQYNHTQQHLI